MCRAGSERFPPVCEDVADVKECLRSLIQGMAALHEAGGAHGRLNPTSCVASATPHGCPSLVLRVVCPRGRALVERGAGGTWHVMRPASQHPQEPEEDVEAALSPPAMRRYEGPDTSIWYRAPELQVQSIEDVLCHTGAPREPACCARHSAASSADVWAVGCIFAEMTREGGEPLFSFAETEFQLLSAHCDYAGYEYTSDEIEIRSEASDNGYALRDLVPAMPDSAFDLLQRMLACDWRERITMAEALQHEFFTGCRCPLLRGSPPRVAVVDASVTPCDVEPAAPPFLYTSCFGFLASSDQEGGPCLPAELASLVEEHKVKKSAGLKRGRCPSTPTSPAPKREAKRERVA